VEHCDRCGATCEGVGNYMARQGLCMACYEDFKILLILFKKGTLDHILKGVV